MGRYGLNGSDAQHCEDRSGVIPKALRRFVRFTLAPDFEIRIGTAVWAPDVGPPRETLTPTPTWTGTPSPSHGAVRQTRVPGRARTFIAAEDPSQLRWG